MDHGGDRQAKVGRRKAKEKDDLADSFALALEAILRLKVQPTNSYPVHIPAGNVPRFR
jgi:hypothetical protein